MSEKERVPLPHNYCALPARLVDFLFSCDANDLDLSATIQGKDVKHEAVLGC
jgi:hypothetical protein